MMQSKLAGIRLFAAGANALAFVLAVALVAPIALAEEGWNSAAVLKLANELESTIDSLYEFSLEAPPQETALQQRTRDATQGEIKNARDLCAAYAQHMRNGWTRAESEPTFRVVLASVVEIRKTGDDAKPAENAKPLIDRLETILDALRGRHDAASRPVDGSEMR
jgi:hypothetical protein